MKRKRTLVNFCYCSGELIDEFLIALELCGTLHEIYPSGNMFVGCGNFSFEVAAPYS